MRIFVGIGYLSFIISVYLVSVNKHTSIGVFTTGGPATTSVGFFINGFVRNGTGGPPTQSKTRSWRILPLCTVSFGTSQI